MRKFLILLAGLMVAPQAFAATVTNKDDVQRTLVVTEGGARSELVLNVGESLEFCDGGCFVTMPNGDREALSGGETIEISGGRAVFK